MQVGVTAPGPGGAEEPPCGGGGSLPLRSPHTGMRESHRHCLKITGNQTIVPKREAERKPEARQGKDHRRDIWACIKHGSNGGPGKRRKREGDRNRCSWLSLIAAVRSHFVK